MPPWPMWGESRMSEPHLLYIAVTLLDMSNGIIVLYKKQQNDVQVKCTLLLSLSSGVTYLKKQIIAVKN